MHDLKKIRTCSPLLPEPGPSVVTELCDYAEALETALRGALRIGMHDPDCTLSPSPEQPCSCWVDPARALLMRRAADRAAKDGSEA